MRPQPVCDLVGTRGQRRERQATLFTRLLDNRIFRVLITPTRASPAPSSAGGPTAADTPTAVAAATKPRATSEYITPDNRPPIRTSKKKSGSSMRASAAGCSSMTSFAIEYRIVRADGELPDDLHHDQRAGDKEADREGDRPASPRADRTCAPVRDFASLVLYLRTA